MKLKYQLSGPPDAGFITGAALAIEALSGEGIGPEDACDCRALAGLLAAARIRDLTIERLDLRTSGDTAGPRDRVVGYGAWALYEGAG